METTVAFKTKEAFVIQQIWDIVILKIVLYLAIPLTWRLVLKDSGLKLRQLLTNKETQLFVILLMD